MYTRLRQTSLLFVIKSNIVLKETKLYHHWLKVMSEKGKIFKLYTNDRTAIRRLKEGRNNAIMLAGGPKLIEGQLLPNNEEYRIIQIAYVQGNYYLILKEETNGESDLSSNQSTTTL